MSKALNLFGLTNGHLRKRPFRAAFSLLVEFYGKLQKPLRILVELALAEAPETLAAAFRRPLAGVSGLRAEEERLLRFLENRRNARRRARRKAS